MKTLAFVIPILALGAIAYFVNSTIIAIICGILITIWAVAFLVGGFLSVYEE